MAIVISGVNNNDKITASDGTIDLLSGVNYAGIITAPAFTSTGNLTAASINVGNNIQVGNAGIITATTLVGNVTGNVNHTSNLLLHISGSEKLRIANSGAFGLNGTNYGSSGQVLTSQGSGSSPTWTTISSTPEGTSILSTGESGGTKFLREDGDGTCSWQSVPAVSVTDQTNNRVITSTGTTDELKGESNLTFDSNQLKIECQNYSYPLVVNSVQSSVRAVIRQTNDANANSGLAIQKRHSTLHPANHWYGDISFEGWDGSGYHKASLIECVAEGTPANDNMPGGLRFSTNARAAGVTERLRIKPDGNVEVKTGNLDMTSGKGIDFSADGSGTLKTLPNSFNAELLHDYENGTFTPNIQYDTGTNRYAGSNVSSAVGEYIRIGDLVSFGMKITLTGNRNYSENIHLYIGGLPYNGMHSSFQSSMMNGWGGWACPTNDNNFSYDVRYCFHGYTTVNLGFSQSSGNGGISGFYVWGFYRTAP